MKTVTPSDDERRVLQAIYGAFQATGTWPAFGQIDRPLLRMGLDAEAIIKNMIAGLIVPVRFGRIAPSRSDPLRLTLLGMSMCEGSGQDIARFLRATRWMAELDAHFEPNQDDPNSAAKVTQADLQELLDLPLGDAAALDRLHAMFQVEPWGLGSGWRNGSDWSYEIARHIHRFALVQTAAQFTAARLAWIQEDQGSDALQPRTYVDAALLASALAADGGRSSLDSKEHAAPDVREHQGAHVFISYSRTDRHYVDLLAAHLRAAGVHVWYDYAIAYGERFEKVIRDMIDSCGAFILVMTPAADESEWVARETRRAQMKGKSVLPLLLDGDIFFSVANLNCHDVTDGSMPNAMFVAQLLK